MKKINLKGISQVLSEKELKNVMGGSGGGSCTCDTQCLTSRGTVGYCYMIPVSWVCRCLGM